MWIKLKIVSVWKETFGHGKKKRIEKEFWIFSLVGCNCPVAWRVLAFFFFLLRNTWKLTKNGLFLQSIPEPEAPVENNVPANEVCTTESADEAPKVPPPAVPVEVSVAPAPAPVITEDVASVTKVNF